MTFAQVQEYEPFMRYGLLGIMIAWVLVKLDRRLESLENSMKANTHKVTGLSRTLLIELLSRENVSIQAKAAAREELARVSQNGDAI